MQAASDAQGVQGTPREAGAAGERCAPLLAFDTSTEMMAVAASGPGGACAINLPGGAAASAQLLPQIESALRRIGLELADLAAIAFGRGPGAFTGLRTSCAVAQGLGLGLALPLLPLDSLLIVAEDALGATPAPGASIRIAVAMDARMDEIYGAVYERSATGWRTVHAPALYALAAWNGVLEEEGPSLLGLAGSALAAFGARMHRPAMVPAVPEPHDRAAALLRLAQHAFGAGAAVDAAAALPLYLRDKVALTTAERAAAKATPPARGIGAAA